MKNTLIEIPVKSIKERDGFNTRYDLGDLREIVGNMQRAGFDKSQPLIVSADGDGYLLGAQGHRRFAAAQEAGLETVFAVLEDDDLSDTDRNLDIVRLNSGEPLPMLAVARVVERHMSENTDATKAEVAKLLGKSAMYITNCTKLTSLTKKTQGRIEQDKISATEVLEIVDELEAKDEAGFKKVEAKVEKMIAKAKDSGKSKATSKDKDDENEEETAEEKAEREAQEKEDAETDAAAKAENKARHEIAKRALKFADGVDKIAEQVKGLPENDKLTPFQSALFNYQIALASFLTGKPYDNNGYPAESGDASKMSDVAAAQRQVEKVQKDELKTALLHAREDAKTTVAETKEKAAAAIKAAKEAAKAKKAEKKD